MDRAGQTHYYLFDGQGSTRQLTGPAGQVTDTYSYDAYGNLTAGTGSTPNAYLYDAQQWDAGTGLYYLRARYYDQAAGRFLGQDPYGGSDQDPVTLHRYLYCGDDPVDGADPGGMDTIEEVSLSEAISGYLQGFVNQVAVKAVTFAAENPGLMRAALYAQGAISVYSVFADPDSAGLAISTGGLSADIETLDSIASDARRAFTVFKDADELAAEGGRLAWRARGLIARLTSDVLSAPNTAGRPLRSLRPPGYDQILATGDGGGPARAHLLGDQLGGPHNLRENFVAMYQDANNVMKTWESQVARRIRTTGDTVYYRVTPLYSDDPAILYPTQIVIEAENASGTWKLNGCGRVVIPNSP
jgi:RHS repeat-associated protein